jgi:hypothetical protein
MPAAVLSAEDKAKEYLSEYSKEKAIDVAETNKVYAEEFKEMYWVDFWSKVISIIENEQV